ncbi:hypothetical protein CRP01_32515 [Flavilitoribacter nigricans DSM 23189 = NBRC 102662]|uniref:Neutral/alkaline non-lysosomal ceramidase N-terminal domain-containing protein n=2 Tax=Flavilitoribacter TaxID=2762562 RepID=A0A2D0N1T2_FLAN2|nr:hypothetical protein CRP01_32515 [Flavilitoribacter nigricans DSM 23189 = NBRC 102662]
MTGAAAGEIAAQSIRVGVFEVDTTPPIGSPVAYAPTRKIVDPLSARGIVILSDEQPIVLCAVDWLGIANEGLELWRKKLAKAAKTTVDRVSVHALHQHDGARCDLTSEKILRQYGLGGTRYDTDFLKLTVKRAAKAVKQARRSAQPVTHLGIGQSKVEKVASNRRILGDDGMVSIIRWSKTSDPKAIAAPEGLIDPWLKALSFWNGDQPIAVLTYYATHPQSYYGQGDVTCEFVGIARNQRERDSGIPHIHFNGAGGNITAGKYNDGSVERRPVLTRRMETAMAAAWEQTAKSEIAADDLGWHTREVLLPPGKHLVEKDLVAQLEDPEVEDDWKMYVAKHLAWLRRTKAGKTITISALRLGKAQLLHLPGELFIEYQLAAQKMRPEDFICTAAYGEYGMGYIGTAEAYTQGGYETSERASRVAPGSEQVLLQAIRAVLDP